MAWPGTYVGSSVVVSDQFSPNFVSVPKPAGVQEGDVMWAVLIALYAGGMGSFSLTGGASWVQGIFFTVGGGNSACGYTKIAGASEPANYSARAAQGTTFAIGIIAYRDLTAPLPWMGGTGNMGQMMQGNGYISVGPHPNPLHIPSVSWPSGGDSRLVYKRYIVSSFHAFSNGTLVQNPAGVTIRNQVSNAFGSGVWADGRWTRDIDTSMYYDESLYTFDQVTVSPATAAISMFMTDDYEWDFENEFFAGKGRRVFVPVEG